ncbi:hypothetical protein ACS0TY_009419 [Phlomoides rotata]
MSSIIRGFIAGSVLQSLQEPAGESPGNEPPMLKSVKVSKGKYAGGSEVLTTRADLEAQHCSEQPRLPLGPPQPLPPAACPSAAPPKHAAPSNRPRCPKSRAACASLFSSFTVGITLIRAREVTTSILGVITLINGKVMTKIGFALHFWRSMCSLLSSVLPWLVSLDLLFAAVYHV